MGFSEFVAILGCDAYIKSEFSPKLLEIDLESLRTKLNWCRRASHEHQLRLLVRTAAATTLYDLPRW